MRATAQNKNPSIEVLQVRYIFQRHIFMVANETMCQHNYQAHTEELQAMTTMPGCLTNTQK